MRRSCSHPYIAFIACILVSSAMSVLASDGLGRSRRSLLQDLQCERIANCLECEMDKDEDSRTIRVCLVCEAGYQPSPDQGKSCVCASGYHKLASGACWACPVGQYCKGGVAQPCGPGLTTSQPGAISINQCVTLPGYAYTRTRRASGDPIVDAAPCPAGTYNVGMNQLPCMPCPQEKTAFSRASEVYRQCFERARTRALLSVDLRPRKTEWVCPAGQVAFPGNYHYCYDEWQPLKKDYDYLPVADAGTVLTPVIPPAAISPTEAWCQSQCGAHCVFYLYNTFKGVAPTGKCSIYALPKTPAPGVKMGFKVDEGVYLIVDADETAGKIGKEVGGVSEVRSVRGCSEECDGLEGCVVFVVRPGVGGRMSCSLREGDLDVDYRTKYKVSKTSLVAF